MEDRISGQNRQPWGPIATGCRGHGNEGGGVLQGAGGRRGRRSVGEAARGQVKGGLEEAEPAAAWNPLNSCTETPIDLRSAGEAARGHVEDFLPDL